MRILRDFLGFVCLGSGRQIVRVHRYCLQLDELLMESMIENNREGDF